MKLKIKLIQEMIESRAVGDQNSSAAFMWWLIIPTVGHTWYDGLSSPVA